MCWPNYTANAVAFPEGHFARLSGSGGDEDTVVRNLRDAPGGCAEDDGFSGLALKDHLLIQFAEAGWLGCACEVDAVETSIRDGAAIDDGDALGGLARGEQVGGAIPGDARAKFGELIGRITAGEKIKHALKRLPGKCSKGRGAAEEIE